MKKYFEGEILLNGVDRLHYREGMGETMEIFDIEVQSEKRKGIGTKLIMSLRQKFPDKHLFAITLATNKVAQKFYEANGFVGVALPKFYPINPPHKTGDAYIYIL